MTGYTSPPLATPLVEYIYPLICSGVEFQKVYNNNIFDISVSFTLTLLDRKKTSR
jgi:hypothetical protein